MSQLCRQVKFSLTRVVITSRSSINSRRLQSAVSPPHRATRSASLSRRRRRSTWPPPDWTWPPGSTSTTPMYRLRRRTPPTMSEPSRRNSTSRRQVRAWWRHRLATSRDRSQSSPVFIDISFWILLVLGILTCERYTGRASKVAHFQKLHIAASLSHKIFRTNFAIIYT